MPYFIESAFGAVSARGTCHTISLSGECQIEIELLQSEIVVEAPNTPEIYFHIRDSTLKVLSFGSS
jgi:hypothetical protein